MKSLLFFVILFIGCIGYTQEIEDLSPNRYRFKYRSQVFKGSRLQITSQLRKIKNSPKFSGIPEEIQTELHKLFIDAKKQAFPKKYKKKAILFLDALYHYEKFVIMYNGALYTVVEKLKRDIRRIDLKLERQYIKSKTAVDRLQKNDPANTKEIDSLGKESQKSLVRLACHRWMKKKFEVYKGINVVENPDALITEFKKAEAAHIFSLFGKKSEPEIIKYLENEIIDFYYKKGIVEIDPEKLELQYVNKYN